jgi:hypothetical protein
MAGHTPDRVLEVELLALGMQSCRRCAGTEKNLRDAVASVAGMFRDLGTVVNVSRHIIQSADDARRLGFVASPTIRVNGHDIATELKRRPCDNRSAGCGCGVVADCRVWDWRGTEYLEAPKPMILDSLLRAYATCATTQAAMPSVMPAQRRECFESGALESASSSSLAADDCCDRAICCEPAAKSECCGGNRSSAGGH